MLGTRWQNAYEYDIMTRHIAVFGETGIDYAPLIETRMAGHGDEWCVDMWPCDEDMTARDHVIELCEVAVISADFILTPGSFGALMTAPKLKLLIQPWVGTDWIDPGFLPQGLVVCNASGHSIPMAEHVLATMLEHGLELRAQHDDMLAGRWHRAGRNSTPESRHGDLAGKKLGLLGYGEIAQAVAARAHAFDMTIAAIARRPRDKTPKGLDWIGMHKDFSRLVSQSDYLVVTCDLNDETRAMVDAAAFAAMKPTAYLVNVARGEIIDEDALYAALKNKQIAGAALDTWYRYPANIANAGSDPDRGGPFQGSRHDFASLDNVLLTPHSAAHTHGADRGRYQSIADTIDAYARQKPMKRYVVTGTGTNLDGFAIP